MYVNYTTFVISLLLNITLYIFAFRRYLMKNYNKQAKEKENILRECIADKEKLIKSYEHMIYLSDQEKLYLKDEIIQLQCQFDHSNKKSNNYIFKSQYTDCSII